MEGRFGVRAVINNTSENLSVENRRRRRYSERARAVFQHRKNIAVHLAPEIEDSLSLVPGLDVCEQELRGNEVVLRFHRKGDLMAVKMPQSEVLA